MSIYIVRGFLVLRANRKQEDVLEYALGLVLIIVPLCLRLFTVNSMRIQNQRMRQADSELRKITDELDEILEQTRSVERQQRQYALRRSRLLSEISEMNGELVRLRRPAGIRMAACELQLAVGLFYTSEGYSPASSRPMPITCSAKIS